MDAYPASQLPAALGRLQRETDMFLATVDSLSEDEMRGPSKCVGWSRAHVVTHVARNADALCNLVEWARTGEEKPAYESNEARDRAIEAGARRPSNEIKHDAKAACARFNTVAPTLLGELAADQVTIRSTPLSSRGLVTARLAEVVIHHDDLDTVWQVEEADIDAQLDALEEAVRRLRLQRDLPSFQIRSVEKGEWTFGNGGPVVRGERHGLVAWLARGHVHGVSCDGELPQVRAFA